MDAATRPTEAATSATDAASQAMDAVIPATDAATQPAAAPTEGPTAAQLRRFIKSRPYVPLHELRRRFELSGDLDEVTPVALAEGEHVFVGLPAREAELLAGLARDGDVGLELCADPPTPVVVGVYPMRPVTRP